jgi:hypothetical protein
MKIVTGKVRFSYANVWEPQSVNGSEPKYSVSLIIPKNDKKTLEKVNNAIEAAEKEGVSRFGSKFTSGSNFRRPLRDGDLDKPDDPAYKNSYFINVNSKIKPGIVDKNVETILDQTEFYSGCYGRASISSFPYSINGAKGITFGLNNLQKLEDGEPLGGISRPEDDFEAVDDDFDDILG